MSRAARSKQSRPALQRIDRPVAACARVGADILSAARGSLALSLYVGGGPLALVTIINLAGGAYANLAFGKINFETGDMMTPAVLGLAVIAEGSRLVAMLVFARALAGFHAVRTGWALVALVIALLATGLAFGLLDPPGNYGGHFIIGAERDGERMWWPAYGF